MHNFYNHYKKLKSDCNLFNYYKRQTKTLNTPQRSLNSWKNATRHCLFFAQLLCNFY